MKTILCCSFFLVSSFTPCISQTTTTQDTTINNLVLPKGYKTSPSGAIPSYTKTGTGKQALILIPGLGFDQTVFEDFTKANKNNYTLYTLTIPGYGNTHAPAMPPVGTSYGEQSWNKGIMDGIKKLIEKEKIQKPVVVGHFVQGTQLALRMAIDYPDDIGGVIILGGPGKFISIQNGEPKLYPLKTSIVYIDKYTSLKFFKNITKSSFDAGNYLPELYSVDPKRADMLWNQSASVPVAVTVRYLCEFFASDVTLELDKIKCPVLILRPTFTADLLSHTENPNTNYIKPQFIDIWEDAGKKNPLIEIQDVQHAAVFLWKDQPEETSRRIKEFIQGKVNKKR